LSTDRDGETRRLSNGAYKKDWEMAKGRGSGKTVKPFSTSATGVA